MLDSEENESKINNDKSMPNKELNEQKNYENLNDHKKEINSIEVKKEEIEEDKDKKSSSNLSDNEEEEKKDKIIQKTRRNGQYFN